MNIDLPIAQLRAVATLFGGNVAGAAQYEKAVNDQTWMPLPAAYVVPLEIEAGEVDTHGGYVQIVTEKISVIVVLDNSVPVQQGDRRGQTAITTIDQAQASVFSAIMNWRPDSTIDNPGNASLQPDQDNRGYVFDGARLVGWDLARLFFSFDFALPVTITDAQGWQPDGLPLTSIGVTIESGEDATVGGAASFT